MRNRKNDRSSRAAREIGLWAVFIVTGACVPQAYSAGIEVVDQSQNSFNVVVAIPANQQIGQSFVPQLSTMDFVELQMFDASLDPHGGSIFLRVREDSIFGSIVGTSPVVFLEDCFQFSDGPGCGMSATQVTPVRFDFAESVPLVAGESYFIEILHAGGDALGVSFDTRNPYADGSGFWDFAGNPFDADLTFREGILVPEPSTALLLGIVALVAGKKRRPVAPPLGSNAGDSPK